MGATIALVDDDPHLLASLAAALKAEGFDVQPYSDPLEALRAMLDKPPDLAILDIAMPEMDGLELLTRLRRHSALPALFLTSKDQEEDELTGLSRGRTTTLPSPFRCSSLSSGFARSCGGSIRCRIRIPAVPGWYAAIW